MLGSILNMYQENGIILLKYVYLNEDVNIHKNLAQQNRPLDK